MNLPDWVNKYIGIGYDSLNCWDLIRSIYLSEFDIDIGDASQQSSSLREKDWINVINSQSSFNIGDVLLFRDKEFEKHVGFALTPDLMLHNTFGTNSCIERWNTPVWRSRLIGIYRHITL